MQVTVRKFTAADLPAMTAIWNGIVEEGNSFPQDKPFTEDEAREFFAAQSFTGVAEADGKVLGLYILHPNNAGRCGHIANASYGVASRGAGPRRGGKAGASFAGDVPGVRIRGTPVQRRRLHQYGGDQAL